MLDCKMVSKNVVSIILDDSLWEYFEHLKKPQYKITGKYLFFSNDRKKLVEIAINEIEKNGFHKAKIPRVNKQKGTYVLCLYYKDDGRKDELYKKYHNNRSVAYQFWKSDEDTLKGKYSKQFLNRLSPEERKEWTKKKI